MRRDFSSSPFFSSYFFLLCFQFFSSVLFFSSPEQRGEMEAVMLCIIDAEQVRQWLGMAAMNLGFAASATENKKLAAAAAILIEHGIDLGSMAVWLRWL
jgi:hypothetical protein